MNRVTQHRRYFMSEFQLYDTDHYITFNIIGIDFERRKITVNISNQGKMSVQTYELKGEKNALYFEYGIFDENKILVDEFETITEE